MKHINQRNIRIIDELMNFCYNHGAKKININIDKQDKETTIIIAADVTKLDNRTLENVKNLLNIPRCHEMEEYYWELTGDDDTDSELSLIGIMTDEANINYNPDSGIEIILKRKV